MTDFMKEFQQALSGVPGLVIGPDQDVSVSFAAPVLLTFRGVHGGDVGSDPIPKPWSEWSWHPFNIDGRAAWMDTHSEWDGTHGWVT